MIRNRYQGSLQGGFPFGVTITMASLRSLAFHRSPLQIRPYEPADWAAIWALLEPVLRAGETFPSRPGDHRRRGPGGVGEAEPASESGSRRTLCQLQGGTLQR